MPHLPLILNYRPFYIQTRDDSAAIDTLTQWGMVAKVSPSFRLPEVKTIYNNDWLDRDGDDEWTDKIHYKALEFDVQFYLRCDGDMETAGAEIRSLKESFFAKIRRGTFMVYAAATGVGYANVRYVKDTVNEVKLLTEKSYTIFTVTFKANNPDSRVTFSNGVLYEIGDVPGQAISFSPASIVSPVAGTSGIAAIIGTGGSGWTVSTSDARFVSFNKISGIGDSYITYSVSSNGTGNIRSGYIYVYDEVGSIIQTISVTQAGSADELGISVSPTRLDYVSTSASAQFVTITDAGSNGWRLSVSNSSWIKVNNSSSATGTGTSTASISVVDNTGEDERVGTVGLYSASGALVQFVTIVQSAGEAPVVTNPTISPSTASIAASGGTVSLSITDGSNVGWRLYCSNSAVSFSRTSGSGSANVTATVANNDGGQRHLVVYLRATSGSTNYGYCDITQAAGSSTVDPTISPTTASASGDAGTTVRLTITDESNLGWRLTCSNSEVTFSQSSGTGAAVVTATLQANSTGASRHLVIYLRPSSGSTSYGYCDITQAAAVVTESYVRVDYTNIDEAAGTFPIYVKAPLGTTWYLSDSAGIITFGTASGVGTGAEEEYQFTIQAFPASSGKTRSTTIFLGDGQALMDDITITQTQSWYLEASQISFGATGGSGTITLTAPTGEPWTLVVENSSWLHLNTTSGSGSATIPFTVDQNGSDSLRASYIEIWESGTRYGNSIDIEQTAGTTNPSMTASKTTGISAAGETITLQISNPSSVDWTLRALYADGDVTFSQSSGSSAATVTATIPANTTGSLLSIEIRLRVNGSSVQTITLSQNA